MSTGASGTASRSHELAKFATVSPRVFASTGESFGQSLRSKRSLRDSREAWMGTQEAGVSSRRSEDLEVVPETPPMPSSSRPLILGVAVTVKEESQSPHLPQAHAHQSPSGASTTIAGPPSVPPALLASPIRLRSIESRASPPLLRPPTPRPRRRKLRRYPYPPGVEVPRITASSHPDTPPSKRRRTSADLSAQSPVSLRSPVAAVPEPVSRNMSSRAPAVIADPHSTAHASVAGSAIVSLPFDCFRALVRSELELRQEVQQLRAELASGKAGVSSSGRSSARNL
ncbi:hypothetical protein EIP91_004903 [Steccherinum ochraceum]|uniref:Uncharacterized protein n=1 Tax=Steccherinum ochraceum TaxID=92696 RepID=A0A4R0RAL7_9APHY|nr:hypothetical protein EIP91_004903 [Steccherinum ochraceum]